MGSNGEGKSWKSEKSSSPASSEPTNNVHVYPDWATMQAYYGPRVPLPPYYNSAMASGHPPHPYMWPPPQPMMPPYGAPYATMYSHGGVYAHPGVPPGSHPNGNGVLPPAAASSLAIETPLKSMGSADQDLLKKLKRTDGLAMSIHNGNAKSAEGVTKDSQSKSSGADGSSEGSDGNTAGACSMNQETKKRSRDGTAVTGGDGKNIELATGFSSVELNSATSKTVTAPVSPLICPGKLVGPVLSPETVMPSERSKSIITKTGSTSIPQNGTVMHSGTFLQNDREVKREKRKQSNRESARRSRLRKQAETEELGRKVERLTAENIALKSEINQLTENSKEMIRENSRLKEKMKNIQTGQTEEISLKNLDGKRTQSPNTENLLSRIDKSGSVERKEDVGRYNKESNLHQVMERKPRANAIVAG